MEAYGYRMIRLSLRLDTIKNESLRLNRQIRSKYGTCSKSPALETTNLFFN